MGQTTGKSSWSRTQQHLRHYFLGFIFWEKRRFLILSVSEIRFFFLVSLVAVVGYSSSWCWPGRSSSSCSLYQKQLSWASLVRAVVQAVPLAAKPKLHLASGVTPLTNNYSKRFQEIPINNNKITQMDTALYLLPYHGFVVFLGF